MSLDARLEQAKIAAAALARETDRLNQRLAAAEETIVALGLGVTAWVHLEGLQRLVFRKYDDEWGLFVDKGAETGAVPLHNASRVLRAQAAEMMPALVDALFDEAEKQLALVRRAIESLDVVLAELPGNA